MPDGNLQGPKRREVSVEIVPYDQAWLEKFEVESKLVSTVLAPWLVGQLEHVGSTAIPGMPAKPIIDIMAPIHSLDSSRPAVDAAASIGYLYAPYKPDYMHWLCKPSPAYRTHHLHLVPKSSQLWLDRLAFRDALREDSDLATEYANLKLRLAKQFRFDREAYTDAKESFVARVLALNRT